MSEIKPKPPNVIIGVTGGIASYKSCELVRLFKKSGHNVKVIMTENAKQFVHPNTFAALSHNEIYGNLSCHSHGGITHIDLAKWADIIIIAPATATTIGRLAYGCADTLLTCVCLASQARCYLAPAMNQIMWEKPVTQNNIQLLKTYGYHIFLPETGEQACGDVGFGRMLEPSKIFQHITCSSQKLANLTILITAGPTIEKLDPVRYLSNFSSGKMGYALARACQQHGAMVHLISGPTSLKPPVNILFTQVTTAQDMLDAVTNSIQSVDIFISTAAVADYSPNFLSQKISKKTEYLSIKLKKTKDILSTISTTHPNIFTIGFCAETQDVIDLAKKKLTKKNCHAMIANEISACGYPFGEDTNTLSYINKKNTVTLPKNTKVCLANQLVDYFYRDFLVFKAGYLSKASYHTN